MSRRPPLCEKQHVAQTPRLSVSGPATWVHERGCRAELDEAKTLEDRPTVREGVGLEVMEAPVRRERDAISQERAKTHRSCAAQAVCTR
jgi:hypothetical protein